MKMKKMKFRAYSWIALSLFLAAYISNNPQSADAGDDQTVDGFSEVVLNGGNSLDPNGDALRYEWKLVSKPADSEVVLEKANIAAPIFVPDVPGDYEFSLIVDDGSKRSGADRVIVHVTGLKSDAGHDQFASLGSPVTLDGGHSRAMDGDSFDYQWSFVTRPRNSVATLSGETSATPSFTPDVAGRYVTQLVISIDKRKSQAALVRVRTSGITADAGENVVTPVGVAVSLDGTKSRADSAGALTYAWDVLQRPTKSVAAVTNASQSKAAFTPDVAGKYLLRLTVSKNSETSTAQVVVTAGTDTTPTLPPPGDQSSGHIKPVTHIASSDLCQSCHNSVAWVPVVKVDHNQVMGACATCHNGKTSTGRPATHIAASTECGACHATSSFTPVIRVDHTQVLGTCVGCHNGSSASGKPTFHITSTDACEQCHSTAAWTPVITVPHDQLTGACISCHNGIVAMGKSPTHLATTNVCEACHSVTTFVPAIVDDHAQVVGTCSSCHNGNPIGGKPASHIVTTAECDLCHSYKAWTPASTTPKVVPASAVN